MCSYIVQTASLADSSAKGPAGWTRVDTARVYYDHPFHSPLDHVLGIDVTCEADGGQNRLALELSPEAARALVRAINDALENGEREHGMPLGRTHEHHHHDHAAS